MVSSYITWNKFLSNHPFQYFPTNVWIFFQHVRFWYLTKNRNLDKRLTCSSYLIWNFWFWFWWNSNNQSVQKKFAPFPLVCLDKDTSLCIMHLGHGCMWGLCRGCLLHDHISTQPTDMHQQNPSKKWSHFIFFIFFFLCWTEKCRIDSCIDIFRTYIPVGQKGKTNMSMSSTSKNVLNTRNMFGPQSYLIQHNL